jgi:hypothetical protein
MTDRTFSIAQFRGFSVASEWLEGRGGDKVYKHLRQQALARQNRGTHE